MRVAGDHGLTSDMTSESHQHGNVTLKAVGVQDQAEHP